MPIYLADARVDQLMEVDGTTWDIGLLQDIFVQEDVSRNSSSIWSGIWGIQAPLHMKKFLWRACSGYLPTVYALATHKVFVNSTCMVCNHLQESVIHALVNCPFVADCWALANLSVSMDGVEDIASWCLDWLSRFSSEEASFAAFICWNVWLNRNSDVWKQVKVSAREIVASAGFHQSSWQAAQCRKGEAGMAEVSRRDGGVLWSKPEPGCLKVNIDAAVFNGNNIVQARQVNLLGSFSPRHAEIIGIREALSWLKGLDHLVIESDARDVILDIRNPGLVEPDMMIKDCLELARQFHNISFVFVRRSANQAAHMLAQNVRYLSGHQEWFCHFPEFLTNVTASDLF
ncbi:uncharacterized protein LOC126660528 [Mercurialis annua]|uniref:uncharacterized protein LOC126660528 n=1 Tax=Mercurialis annua TaxID=3986 RepID=UPI00215E31EE|nr:uncharacterized protein LOC126660528 [Mercurialis annua]